MVVVVVVVVSLLLLMVVVVVFLFSLFVLTRAAVPISDQRLELLAVFFFFIMVHAILKPCSTVLLIVWLSHEVSVSN